MDEQYHLILSTITISSYYLRGDNAVSLGREAGCYCAIGTFHRHGTVTTTVQQWHGSNEEVPCGKESPNVNYELKTR